MSTIKRPRSLRAELGLCALLAATAAGATQTASAEEAASMAGPLVVVGERRDQNPYGDPEAPYRVERSANGLLTEDLVDTPKSISVIPAEAIEDLGATTFRDLFRAQPGVTLGTGEGGNAFGDRIFVRGYDARNDVYIDGARDPGVGSREVFAVQQIEIMKGPSGAFAGRGTTGGAVSLVSKQPGEGSWGDLEVSLGTEDTRRVTIDANHEVTDSLAVRVNGMVHEGGVAGRDHVYNDRWGAALAVAYTPNDRLRLGFDYYHLTTEYLPDWGIPYDVANNRPFAVDRNNFYGVLARDEGNTFADVYTLNADYRLADGVTLHSTLRYGQSGNAYTASAPEQPDAVARTVRANAKRRDAVTDYLVHQTHAKFEFATGGIGHTLVAGYELSREETLNRQRAFTECAVLPCTGTTSNPTLDLDNPDSTIPWGRATEITSRPVITTETTALFVVDTLEFSPRWRAFVGLRGDDYTAETSGLSPDRQSESQFLSWHGGLVFKPAENASLYVSAGSSANPPCEQLDAFSLDYGGCDVRIATRDPVENLSFEAGAKATLFGHLDATAAVFRILRDGVPISFRNGATTTIESQDQEVVGVEFTIAGDVTERWSVFGGLTAFDTEITASPNPAELGRPFPNVSEVSFSLTSRHQLTDRIHLGGTAVYQSEKFGGSTAAGSTKLPEFWRYDLFGGVRLTERLEVSFNVLNVGDETYYDAIYRSGTPFSYIAPGRSALVTLDVDF